MTLLMSIRCPFCGAPENARVDATDAEGEKILLVMFDCPFYYRFRSDQIGSGEAMQRHLEQWRLEAGDNWLESIGPVMKAREIRNMERFGYRQGTN